MAERPVAMSEAEARRAAARDDRMMALCSWRVMSRLLGLREDYRVCGAPLGGAYRRYEPRKGVYNPVHYAASCHDVWCPRCGQETWMRRWALLVLAGADWVREGGYLVFVSIAGQHSATEPFQAKYDRWRWVWNWWPGKGDTPARRFMAAYGIEGWVKVSEATVGGVNGANVGGHLVLFCRPVEDERPEWTAADLARRLQMAMSDSVAGAAERGDPLPVQHFGHFLSDVAFHSRLAGVSEVAGYVSKLADGPGLAGAASEATDPTGAKVGTRNIGMRALSVHIGRETRRMGYRQPTFALRRNTRLAGLVEQYGEVRAAMRGRGEKTYIASRGVFGRWAEMETVDLIDQALQVIADDDPATSEIITGYLDDTAPTEDVADDAPFRPDEDAVRDQEASRAFHRGEQEEGSIPHDDPEFFAVVNIDSGVAYDWWQAHDLCDRPADVDLGLVRLLDRLGAREGVQAVERTVRRCTGERLFTYERLDPQGRRELLIETVSTGPPGWWAIQV